jgi:glutamate N-acetyltransferase/amino-acid N-acetyltransferase
MSDVVSPLAPDAFPTLPPIAGVQLATHAAGIKYEGRADLFLASVAEGTVVAGTFTRSLCPSAPVDWCRRVLSDGNRTARAVVCNSGNANAFTGQAGSTAAALTAQTIADALGASPDEIFLASTGVIGETLPEEAMREGLPKLAEKLGTSSADGW